MEILYSTTAMASGGRNGRVRIEESRLDLPLSLPTQMGGPGGSGTNPEQLFGAAYAACFGGALQLLAGQRKLSTGEITVTAKVSVQKDGPGLALAVELLGSIPALSREQAQELMTQAHAICPYSKAIRNNVSVTLTLA